MRFLLDIADEFFTSEFLTVISVVFSNTSSSDVSLTSSVTVVVVILSVVVELVIATVVVSGRISQCFPETPDGHSHLKWPSSSSSD